VDQETREIRRRHSATAHRACRSRSV